MLLILQKICHGQAENDTTFETFNFNYKYLHNCLDWSGFYIYKFQNIYTLFRLLKNEFVKLPHHWHDLIINPPCRTSPLPKIVPCLPRKAFRKKSLHTFFFFWEGGGGVGETLCFRSIGKWCSDICSLKICEEVWTKTC